MTGFWEGTWDPDVCTNDDSQGVSCGDGATQSQVHIASAWDETGVCDECGNGTCNASETCNSCETDCAACSAMSVENRGAASEDVADGGMSLISSDLELGFDGSSTEQYVGVRLRD